MHVNKNTYRNRQRLSSTLIVSSELGTLEWWISGLMLNPLFLLDFRDYVSLEIKYLDQQI